MSGAGGVHPGGRCRRLARRELLRALALVAGVWAGCGAGTWKGAAWSPRLLSVETPGSRAAAASPKVAMLRWPWGPRVQVGERTFRIDVRPDPRRPVRLVVWDVAQPPGPGRSRWKTVLEEAIASVRQVYPALEVELRVLAWQQLDAELEQALRQQTPPDVLGTPETTYVYDPRWQVPLEGYLAHALDPPARAELLPGAASLAEAEGRLWGLPRWVEWTGWAVRTQGGGARMAVDLANPLTWRMLVLTAPASARGVDGAGSSLGGRSIWSGERLREVQSWLDGLRAQLVPPARVAELGPLELLLRGEAAAGGPVTGRLAYRLGAWAVAGPRSAGAAAPSALALAGALAVQGAAAQLPGPLISASSYVLFAPPGADDARLRLAWEVAVALARHTARALAATEGVIPAWNPEPPRPVTPRRPVMPGRPGGRTPPGGPAWWERYSFPPGAREALLAGGGSAGAGTGEQRGFPAFRAGVRGALDWSDGLHERDVVAQWALRLARGRVRLEEFVRQVSR